MWSIYGLLGMYVAAIIMVTIAIISILAYGKLKSQSLVMIEEYRKKIQGLNDRENILSANQRNFAKMYAATIFLRDPRSQSSEEKRWVITIELKPRAMLYEAASIGASNVKMEAYIDYVSHDIGERAKKVLFDQWREQG